MKIRDTPFFKTNPLFYQPLPFYGKNLTLPHLFVKVSETQTQLCNSNTYCEFCRACILYLSLSYILFLYLSLRHRIYEYLTVLY